MVRANISFFNWSCILLLAVTSAITIQVLSLTSSEYFPTASSGVLIKSDEKSEEVSNYLVELAEDDRDASNSSTYSLLSKRSTREDMSNKYSKDSKPPISKPVRSKSDPESLRSTGKEKDILSKPRSKSSSKRNLLGKYDSDEIDFSKAKYYDLEFESDKQSYTTRKERRGDTEPIPLLEMPNGKKGVYWAVPDSGFPEIDSRGSKFPLIKSSDSEPTLRPNYDSESPLIEMNDSESTLTTPEDFQPREKDESFDPHTFIYNDEDSDEGPVQIPADYEDFFAKLSDEDIPGIALKEDGLSYQGSSDEEGPSVSTIKRRPKKFRTKAVLHSEPEFEVSSNESANEASEAPQEKGNVIFLDIAAGRKLVEEDWNDSKQTASFSVRSQYSGSYAFGVADRLVESERTVPKDSLMPGVLCNIAESIYAFSKANLRAHVLLDKAFGRILGKETKVEGYVAAVFGTVTRYGKMSVSVLGNSGAAVYRKGKLHQTEVVINPEGEKYVMSLKPTGGMSDISKLEKTFDMFTGKLNYECNTHTGDIWLFASADVMKFTTPNTFTDFIERYHSDSAKELASKFMEIVVNNIREQQSKAEDAQLCSCFPCFRKKIPEIPTDISLVIVKVL